MRSAIIFALALLLGLSSGAQELHSEKPKLVVGIVVDQMRYDYLTRFWERFGNKGFKRLVSEGYTFKNNHFNYIPTYTGPGHASIWTGTSPKNHGIIGNSWFNKYEDEFIYCTDDDMVSPVGTDAPAGKMSPVLLKTTSVADQNRLHTQMRGKTIGVAIKDRGSILPAGHTANAAYWFHGGEEGRFITSSYYMKALPQWVKDFNDSDRAESYFRTWNSLYEIKTYQESGADENVFERGFTGKDKATFPYDLDALKKENGFFSLITQTPFGNDLTTDFALAAIEGEALGQDGDTDILSLSFSSTDYIGHNFGVNSKEVEDAYLRLDQNIAQILEYLDQHIGEGDYTLFLTADHGAVDVPNYLQSVGIPGGYFNDLDFAAALQNFVQNEYGKEDLIRNVSNGQIFFNYENLLQAGIATSDFEEVIASYTLQQDQIDKVFTRRDMVSGGYTHGVRGLLLNGFNQRRSGDVMFVLDPATIIYPQTGSTHGSGNTYDTHAPLIFFGSGIRQGSTTRRSEIVDIAPTLAALLGISFPNGASGSPLYIMLDE